MEMIQGQNPGGDGPYQWKGFFVPYSWEGSSPPRQSVSMKSLQPLIERVTNSLKMTAGVKRKGYMFEIVRKV